MDSPLRFRPDLYRGTAHDYERYRVPYPAALIDDLVARADLRGAGRLVDLACGPGRLTFALAGHFAQVLAVDQEREAIAYAEALAAERHVTHVDWRTGRAEDLDVEGQVELVTAGDAFHRLDRPRVATLARGWLQPGGHIAVLWSSMPWQGPAAWQEAAMDLVVHWMDLTGSRDNIPADLAETMADHPNLSVLADAGLDVVGTYEFTERHRWTPSTLAGFAYSTSILSRAVLGDRVDAFERDLRDRLLPLHPDGTFEETATFAYDLAVKRPGRPAPVPPSG